MLIFWLLNLDMEFLRSTQFRTFVDLPKCFLWKSDIYHSIKLPFDVEVAEKFLNGVYYSPILQDKWLQLKGKALLYKFLYLASIIINSNVLSQLIPH